MQSENFDNKIKEAADQHHPNYDEKAWAKMEKLLDRHLPQKDDRRRRIIFFLLFLLLAGGGAWLAISKPWTQSNQTSIAKNSFNKNGTGPSANSTKERTDKSTAGNIDADKDKVKETITVPVIKYSVVSTQKKDIEPDENAFSSNRKKNSNSIVERGKENTSGYKQNKFFSGKNEKADQLAIDIAGPETKSKDKDREPVEKNATVISSLANNNKLTKSDNTKSIVAQPLVNEQPQHKIAEVKKDDKPIEQPKTADKKETAKKSGGIKKTSSFFFSFSAGPDISSVGLDNPGKVRLSAGAGFGYTFNNRWTIRTGFYTGRKIYSANKYDYKPAVQPLNYNYLDNISADCKVYEIPLSVAYNFSRSAKHSLFASAGLSSYIMKKETYDYLYKYSGTSYNYTKTINDENKHYFSVLTLSAGYQRKINRTFSIGAEPYFKLPLSGIGFGKVKLNSAGILFSLIVSPFQPAAKK
jgi:hypothetical protein